MLSVSPMLAAAFTWRPVMPELLLLGAMLVLPLIGLGLKGTQGKRDLGRLTVVILFGALLLDAIMLWRGNMLGVPIEIAGYGALYEVNAFSQFLKLIFLGVGLLLAMASIEYATVFKNPIEYYTLLISATIGMMVVASSTDLITLFIGIETASLSSYILAGYAKNNKFGIEASTKYFIIGALSSAIFLYGISLIYGIAGSTSFDVLTPAFEGAFGMTAVTRIALVLVLVGIGFKISAAPFHMWAPDVYYGAPDTVGGLLAGSSKAMGFAAAFKILLVGMAAAKAEWTALVAIIAIASMTLGNLAALRQTSIKRLLAYSSIAQAGYILIAVVVGTEYAVAGGLFHLTTNGIMKGTAFIIVAALGLWGISDKIEDFRGLKHRSPWLAFALTIMLLSLAGVPPFGGFASKFTLFSSAVYASFTEGQSWMLWLAVAGIVNSLISVFYYAKVVRYMYGETAEPRAGEENGVKPIQATLPTNVAIGIGLVLIIALGVWPDLILVKATEAAQSLLAGVGV